MVWLSEINNIKCVRGKHPFTWYFSQKYQQVGFYWIILNLPLWSNPRLIKIHACFYNIEMWKELIFRFTNIVLKTLYNVQSCAFKLPYYVNVYVFKALISEVLFSNQLDCSGPQAFCDHGPVLWKVLLPEAGGGAGLRTTQAPYFHFLHTVCLLLLRQLHLLWSVLRARGLGSPRNVKIGLH